MQRYFKLTAATAKADPSVTHMRVDFYYSKGGMNVFTYKQEPRGYYVILQPVERKGIMEGFVAFSGKKVLLREVARASAKQEQEAQKECAAYLDANLAHIANSMGYTLGEECM